MALRFSPRGTTFAYSSFEEGVVNVLDTKTFKPLHTIRFKRYVESLSYLDDSLLLAISADGCATVWNLKKLPAAVVATFAATGRNASILQIINDEAKRAAVVYHVSDPWLAFESTMLDFDSEPKTRTASPRFAKMTKPGRMFCMSPRSKYLITGDSDGEIVVMAVSTNKIMGHVKIMDIPWTATFLDSDNSFAVGCIHGGFYVFRIGGLGTTEK